MATVVSFINYKGGVGKTTTAYHIGCSLALHHDKKVLLVDVDPQTNLTFLCAIPERWEEFRNTKGTLATLYRAHLNGKSLCIRDVIWKSPIERARQKIIPNVDLIPSDVELLTIDLDLQMQAQSSHDLKQLARFYLEQRSILAEALREIESEYDYILIDCPPNLYLVTQNGLAASHYYFVPALPDHLSTIGIEILIRRVKELNRDLNLAGQLTSRHVRCPELRGIVFIRVRQGGTRITNTHERTMGRIREAYSTFVFGSYTTEGIGYGEAAEEAIPTFVMNEPNPRRVAEQYMNITDEFLRKLQ